MPRILTTEEREATVAFGVDLELEFRATTAVMWKAFGAGDKETYEECVLRNRLLYRELAEVEVALRNNALPF